MNVPQKPLTNAEADDEIDLLALVGVLLDYKWLLVVVIATFTLLGMVYAALAPPVYRADALLQIEAKKSSLPGMSGLAELTGKEPEASTEIELIKSRFVVGKAVNAMHLDVHAYPQRFPKIGSYFARRFVPKKEGDVASPLLPYTEKYDWGGAEISVAQLDLRENLLGKELEVVAGKDGHYTVQDSKTDVLLLEGKVGQVATAPGITLLIDKLQANPGQYFNVGKSDPQGAVDGLRFRLQVAERGKFTGIISMSLDDVSPAFAKKALNEIARQYVRQNVERKSEEAASSLQFVRDQLPQVRAEMDRATAALNRYQVNSKSVDISTETQAVLKQVVDLEASISDLQMKKFELDKKFTPEHPAYQTVQRQLADMQTRKKALEEKVSNLPETQQELLKLTRDVEVSTEIYTQLQNRSQELDIMRAGTVGDARIIDSAESYGPVKPNRPLIVLLATLMGVVISVVLVGLHVALTRGVEDPTAIEALGVQVNATIPFSQIQEDSEKTVAATDPLPVLTLTHPTDPAIEAIRSLRTSMHFQLMDAANNVISISGPSPGVGKTFVSANVAVAMAQAGKKVLLIDADMRKGYMQRFFGLESARAGLSNLLGEGAALEDVIVHTEVKGLDFVARGPVQKNPSELLLGAMFAQFIKYASANYDVVVIDTPPVLAVADPIIVSKLAGSNFIVARFSKNPIGEIQATIKRFSNHGVKLDGIILNATFKRSLAYYGYQKYGYNNYQYNYYGTEEKKSRWGFFKKRI